jgi:hypothetical protein
LNPGSDCNLKPVSVQEIKTAVRRLSSEEFAAFRRWILEYDEEGWNVAATELDHVLVSRLSGPFEPIEPDWKDRVRRSAADLRDS